MFRDEARVGQVGRTGRVWYERGVRPRGLRDRRHEATWIFGAICPERETGVSLLLPEASVPAMQALIDELASRLSADRHPVLVMDRAGWHIARKLDWPDTITPLHLPPYSPELNALLSEVEGRSSASGSTCANASSEAFGNGGGMRLDDRASA